MGAPVEKNCERCGGLGLKRQPSTLAFSAIRHLVPELKERTWRRNWKPFYEALVNKCEMEESSACDEFKKITR